MRIHDPPAKPGNYFALNGALTCAPLAICQMADIAGAG
jgi:hypothetical protein